MFTMQCMKKSKVLYVNLHSLSRKKNTFWGLFLPFGLFYMYTLNVFLFYHVYHEMSYYELTILLSLCLSYIR